jgi:pimeloyl-ACP methyl ester carboxylesterase
MSFSHVPTMPPATPTVILLHASGSSSRQWDTLAEALRPSYSVVALDFHDHGSRPAGARAAGSSVANDAALVEAALASAGGAHLIGHSYGGAVAMQVAMSHPHLVRSVAVFEPVLFRLLVEDDANGPFVRTVFAVVADMTARLAEHRPMEAARRFVEFWTAPHVWHGMPQRRQRAIALRAATVIGHFFGLFGAPSPHRAVAGLQMPVLCLTGERTVPAARRIGELLAELLGPGHHETMPGMGHMGPITHAEHVNRRLLAFLAAHAGGATASRLERIAA